MRYVFRGAGLAQQRHLLSAPAQFDFGEPQAVDMLARQAGQVLGEPITGGGLAGADRIHQPAPELNLAFEAGDGPVQLRGVLPLCLFGLQTVQLSGQRLLLGGQCLEFRAGATGAQQQHTVDRGHDHDHRRHQTQLQACGKRWLDPPVQLRIEIKMLH